MAIENITEAQKVNLVKLYLAYFNRAPETQGLDFHVAAFLADLNAGLSEEQAFANRADSFYQAAIDVPAWSGYSVSMTAGEFVAKMYDNVLLRPGAGGNAPTQAEIDYWVDQLQTGAVTRGGLITAFLDAVPHLIENGTPEEVAIATQVKTVLDARLEVALEFVKPEHSGALTGQDAFTAGKNALVGVVDADSAAARIAQLQSAANTYTLTEHADIATANVFDAPQVYTPGGNDRINSLQNDDVLTGSGDNPTLNAVLGNPGDNGLTIITPTLNGVETINARFDSEFNMTLDLQDASGVKNVNITRVADGANATVRNIADPVEGLSVANSQAPDGDITFNFLNKAVSGADDTVNLTLSNVDVNAVVVQERGNAPAEGFETINLASTGSENEVNVLVAEDLQTLNISGDQELTLGGQTVVRRADGAVEAVRGEAGLANVAGSLSKIDASAFEADLNIVLGAEINAGQDGTSGKAVEFEFIGGKGDDTIVLADAVVGGAVGNTDKIDGGEGENTLIVTGNTTINAGGTAAAPVANVTNIQALAILSGHDNGVAGDLVNINADAFDSLSSIYVRNEGQDFGQFVAGVWTPGNPAAPAAGDAWFSRAEMATVNLNNLTAEQAQAITLAHGTTGNSDIQNNNLNVNLKVATGAADAAQVTIVDGVNTDPVFNARIAAAAVERVTLVDSDTESNTIHLNQGAFTQAGSSITVKGGAAGQYMSLDSFNGQSGAAGAVNFATGNGYGYATDGTPGNNTSATAVAARDAAVSTVFYGTVGTAADNVTRHVVENVDASEYAGDFVIRVGELTRADGTTSMNIKTGAGNDTVIFDALGSTSAGFTSGDTVAMGEGNDTLVIDGNTATIPGTPRIDIQTSEWDNVSGVDVLRFGNNAGVANVGNGAQVTNAGGAYYVRIDDEFIKQTDAGDRLTIVNNDGDLVNNTESDAVVDLRGVSQNLGITFLGANGVGTAGISSNRIVVDDAIAKSNQILNGGDTDVTAGSLTIGNNNVYEVRNTANVSINDLANTSNFGRIEFTNDQAVAQTLTLTLNNTVVGNLVDASNTASSVATQEVLRVVAADNGGNASVLNIDARDVSGFHGLNVTGSVAGADVITLNANVGGTTGSTLVLGASAGDTVNWVGGAAGTIVNVDTVPGTTSFQLGAVTTNHAVTGAEVVDLSGLTYASSTIAAAAGQTIIGGAGVDTITAAGAVTITGGGGADVITLAAAGTVDTLVYRAQTDSTTTVFDSITNFTTGEDKINLSAVLGGGGGAPAAVTAAVAAFSGLAGEFAGNAIAFFDDGANTTVYVDVDGNGLLNAADMSIQLTGTNGAANVPVATDFLV